MENGGYDGLLLLPGQRFCPMEDELLMFYLKPKVNSKEVPGKDDLICELDLYGDQDPWKIWERFEARRANDLRKNKDLYFFTQKKKKTARGSRINRTVGSGGTWKGQNAAKEIYLLDQNQQPTTTILGFKKTYTYKNKGSVHDGRWIMYEYELDESQLVHKKQVNKKDYVLCLLRKNDEQPEKKRKRQEEEEMLGDSDQDDDGNDNLNIDEPQAKWQCLLPSAGNVATPSFDFAEAEKWFDQQLSQPALLEPVQESGPTTLEAEPWPVALQVDENMELEHFGVDQGAKSLELAELEKWFKDEFEAQPQLGEGNLEQKLAGDEMSGLQYHQDENHVQQMANLPNIFLEELMNDERPNTMEVGDWNAANSDFEYLAF